VSAPRVGIVGARRARQGLGPFVARDLVTAGAEVVAFTATSEATRAEAGAQLRDVAGVTANAHESVGAMLAAESLDAVAILSPAEHHEEALEAALASGTPTLCEKPFIWGVADLAARASAITRRFDEAGLLLWENCQWPRTLPSFAKLHPGALDAPPRRFEMELQPASRGLQAIGDSLPHVVSMLQALCPGTGTVAAARFEEDGDALTVRFRYEFDGGTCDVHVRLLRTDDHPRRAAVIVDGRRADRLVSGAAYQLSFAADDRSVPLEDPLTLLVNDFVAALRVAGTSRTTEIAARMQNLADLNAAYDAAASGSTS
jgi:predicted dehydrogenase